MKSLCSQLEKFTNQLTMTEIKSTEFLAPIKPMVERLLKSLEENPMSQNFNESQIEYVVLWFSRPIRTPMHWDMFIKIFNSLAPGQPDLDEWDVKRAYAEVTMRLEQVTLDFNLPGFDGCIARKEKDLVD